MSERQPDPEARLRAAIRTIEKVRAPAIRSVWARGCSLGLVGQLRYALTRLGCRSLAERNVALERCPVGLFAEFPALRSAAETSETQGLGRVVASM